jgi:hypothetical protein
MPERFGTDPLWGGTLDRLDLSLIDNRVAASIRVPTTTGTRHFELLLTGVRQLRYVDPDPISWDYTEFTGITIEPADPATGARLQATIELWSGTAMIWLLCDDVSVAEAPRGLTSLAGDAGPA